MTDLTNDFKSGRLKKNKHYYIKTDINREFIKFYGNKGFKGIVKEVLTDVPTYEELQALKEENARLKRLFQQWQEIHKHMVQYHGYINHSEFHPTFMETEKFIDEVLK